MGGGSRHGRFRYATALLLVSVVVLASAAPASGIIDPTAQCWTISGTVMDPYARAVPGALIATNGGCEGPVGVVTDSNGGYSFSASGNLLGASVTIRISKSGFTQQDKTVSTGIAGGTQSSGSGSSAESSSAAASNAGGVLDPDDVVDTNDVVLQYDPGALVTPALRSGETLFLSARNPAPPATGSTAPGAHVRVDLPDGSTQQLIAGATDSEGFTTWAGSYAVAPTWAEGSYAAVFCVVEQSFIGSCAQAQQVHDSGTNVLVSPLQTKIYVVDNTAPEVAEAFPQRFRTVLGAQPIGARWFDGGSGIDPASLELRLDGVTQTGSLSGATIMLPSSAMTQGIHFVEVSAEDLAGNMASDSFLFTRATLEAGPVDLATPSAAGSVVAEGLLGSRAHFSNVPVEVGHQQIELSATTQVGGTRVVRDINVGVLHVVFDHPILGPSTVPVMPPDATVNFDVAAIAPASDQLIADFQPQLTTLPPFSVAAPPGYGGEGTTARLQASVTTAAGEILTGSSSDGLFTVTFKGHTINVTGAVATCFDESAAARLSCANRFVAENSSSADVRVEGQGDRVFGLLRNKVAGTADPDAESALPGCFDAVGSASATEICSGSVDSFGVVGPARASSVGQAFGCPTALIAVLWVNLCSGRPTVSPYPPAGSDQPDPAVDGFFGAWLNAGVYRVQNSLPSTADDTFPLWQQDHLDAPPSGSSCAEGVTGTVTATVIGASAVSASLDDASVNYRAGTRRVDGTSNDIVDVHLGTFTGATARDQPDSPGEEWTGGDPSALPFQLSTALLHERALLKIQTPHTSTIDAQFQLRDGLWWADGSETGGAAFRTRATSNTWQPAGYASPNRLQLVTGANFSAAGDGHGYDRVAVLAFSFSADFDCGV